MLRCVGQAHIPPILDKSYLCPTNLGFSAYSLSACSKNKWQGYSNAYLASKRICSQQAWWSCLPSPPAAKSGEAFPWIILLNEEIRLWCSTFWYKGCVLEDFLLRFSKDSPPLPPPPPHPAPNSFPYYDSETNAQFYMADSSSFWFGLKGFIQGVFPDNSI